MRHGAELLQEFLNEGCILLIAFPLRQRHGDGPWVASRPDGGPLVGLGAQKKADIGAHIEVQLGAHRVCVRFNDDMRGHTTAAFSAVDGELTVRFG